MRNTTLIFLFCLCCNTSIYSAEQRPEVIVKEILEVKTNTQKQILINRIKSYVKQVISKNIILLIQPGFGNDLPLQYILENFNKIIIFDTNPKYILSKLNKLLNYKYKNVKTHKIKTLRKKEPALCLKPTNKNNKFELLSEFIRAKLNNFNFQTETPDLVISHIATGDLSERFLTQISAQISDQQFLADLGLIRFISNKIIQENFYRKIINTNAKRIIFTFEAQHLELSGKTYISSQAFAYFQKKINRFYKKYDYLSYVVDTKSGPAIIEGYFLQRTKYQCSNPDCRKISKNTVRCKQCRNSFFCKSGCLVEHKKLKHPIFKK